jgi:3-oxoadipate enol-lactonase
MPSASPQSNPLHYQIDGESKAPWLVLSNSLGTTLDMWAPQMPALLQHFRVLRYDTRGHGRSLVSPGPYTIDQLGADVITLMDQLEIERAHFCGLSMGGMTGMWLGVHQPHRIDRLALCNTAALIGPPSSWTARIEKVLNEGMDSISPAVMDRWFTPRFQREAPEQVARVRDMLLATSPQGYAANCAAIRDMDLRSALGKIKAPTLVIAGSHDLATPPADGALLAREIEGAQYVEFDAAHLSNWEQPRQFEEALLTFLRG